MWNRTSARREGSRAQVLAVAGAGAGAGAGEWAGAVQRSARRDPPPANVKLGPERGEGAKWSLKKFGD